MGIPGLWKILEPTSQNTSLIELSIREGFVANRHGTHSIVVGIDASPMIYATQAVFAGPGYTHVQAGQNPELRTLFFRLCWLSRSGVNAVFVFDGPNRPKCKCNRRVSDKVHWITKKFQDLIQEFGFSCHTAPGEAEAELAHLNACQAIDAVLTSDSNIFLFGAKQIIRSPADTRHLDKVSVFMAQAFEDQDNKLFTIEGFFLMAVLSSGDYDPAGLPNCGLSIASALAAGPLAQSLYDATKNLTEKKLRDFLPSWRDSLRHELANDPDKRLGRRYIKIAQNIPSAFPDPVVLRQYCRPLTSVGVPNDAITWFTPQVPHTAELAKNCSRLFDWGPDIVDHFISHVWDGYLIRKLIKGYSTGAFIPSGPPNLNFPTIDAIQKIGDRSSSSLAFHFYQVTFWIPSLVAEAATAVLDDGGSDTVVQGLAQAHSILVWIPAPVFQATNRHQIVAFHDSHPRAKSPHPTAAYHPILEEFEMLA